MDADITDAEQVRVPGRPQEGPGLCLGAGVGQGDACDVGELIFIEICPLELLLRLTLEIYANPSFFLILPGGPALYTVCTLRGRQTNPASNLHTFPISADTIHVFQRKTWEESRMKATGIVRRIDDLGRVVIPKEIRRTMRIREGDPLEIYTSRDGEVIFKKYSLMGGLDDFAAQFCETLSKSCGAITAVTDRDTIIAVAGGGKRELMGKRISSQLEQIMEDRRIYQHTGDDRRIFVTESGEKFCAAVAAPIISEGDVLGLVLFVEDGDPQVTGETEYKLAQTIAAFLGKHMEN